MDLKINKFNIKILILVLLILFLLLLTLSFVGRKANLSYQPYLADEIFLVFADNQENLGQLNNLDFLVTDLQKLKNIGKNPAVITFNKLNEKKDIGSLLPWANNIYIDIFSNPQDTGSVSKFKNLFNINQPLELKSHLTEDNYLKIFYDQKDRRVNFILVGEDLKINKELIKLNDLTIFTIENIEPKSILKIGNMVIDLISYQNDSFLTLDFLLKNNILTYTADNNNLLASENYSFEKGLWGQAASDCSAYLPGDPDLSMSLKSDATNGKTSLELASKNHFACSLKTFPLKMENNKLYKLSFDYKNVTGGKVQYYYNLRNDLEEKQDKFGSFEAGDNNWHTFETLIDPQIEKINNFDLYFYAPSDGSSNIVNLYDNVKLESFSLTREETLPAINFPENYSLSNWVKLTADENTFAYPSLAKNLIENFNYSFEAGLWNNQVADCSDYLAGNHDLSMSLKSDATNGKTSLELASKNHFACSLKTFPLKMENNKLYKLSFDYKNVTGGKVQYYYNLRNDLEEKQDKFGSFEAGDNNWHTFETLIDPQIEKINNFDLYFYAPSDGSSNIINLYDNVKLAELAPKGIYSYYLYARTDSRTDNQMKKIDTKIINTRKNIVVLKEINNPVFLVYPKKYDSHWNAYLFPKNYSAGAGSKKPGFLANFFLKTIDQKYHFQVNNYSNGWLIDPKRLCAKENRCQKVDDNTYDIYLIIEHEFNKFINFSLISILTVMAFLFFYLKRYGHKL